MPKDEINERVEKAARILELTENLDRRPGQLSGGQRQRVAMGRAIVRQPQAFLMDEPLSNLDAKLRVQMRAEVSKIQHSLNVTTVYVTHDQIEAMTMGDRVAVLSRRPAAGRHAAEPLRPSPQPVRRRLHRLAADEPAPSRRVTQRQRHDVARGQQHLTVPPSLLAASPSLAGYDGRQVAVGIRPEHLKAGTEGAPDTICGVIDVREGLGSEVILHMVTDAVGVDTSRPRTAGRRPTASSWPGGAAHHDAGR